MAFGLLIPVAKQRRRRDLSDNVENKAHHILDFRDSVTSLALLKFTNVFKEMKSDEILECVGQNPNTMADFFKVLSPVSYEVVIKEEFENKYFRILLKKKPNVP
jgi:TusA-related sulfurtransferase